MDTLYLLREVLITLLTGLACVWLIVDIARKLRCSEASSASSPGREIQAPASPAVSAALAAPAVPIAAPAAADEIPPEHLAVITASIHHLFGGSARIRRIEPDLAHAAWAREGRRDIFSSHRVR